MVGALRLPHQHGDGGGLYLQVSDSVSKSWIYRYSLDGRRREMGLGAYPEITLSAAREAAAEARALRESKKDPISVRDEGRARERLRAAQGILWGKAVDQFMGAHEGSWRNRKHRQQWRNTLETYATPVIGKLQVQQIDLERVKRVLEPIWQDMPETASRVRGRIERILD